MKSALMRDQSLDDMNSRSSVRTKAPGSSSWFLLLAAVCVMSLITCAIILMSNAPYGYRNMAFLPLSFLFVSVMYSRLYLEIHKNIAVLLILVGYFIRDVATPLALALGNYTTVFPKLSSENINTAIFLMMYEVVIVFTGIHLYLLFKRRSKGTIRIADSFAAQTWSYRSFNAVLLLCVLFCIGVFLYIPEIGGLYKPIFGNSQGIASINYTADQIALRGSLRRVLFTLFTYVLSFIRYVIPAYFIYVIYKKKGDSLKGIILSVPFLVLPFLVVGTTNIEPFLGLLLNMVLVKRLYPRNSQHLTRAFLILGGSLVISIFGAKMHLIGQSTGNSGFESLSEVLCAYFPGVGNAAATYNIVDINPLKTLFYDFYSTIPFRGSLFGLAGVSLAGLFNESNGIGGNIIPCVSYAEHYLGFAIAPLVPMSMAVLSLVMHDRAENTNEYWQYFYFVFAMIFLAIAPNMYNSVIYLSWAFGVFLPLLVLTKFIERRRGKGESKLMLDAEKVQGERESSGMNLSNQQARVL